MGVNKAIVGDEVMFDLTADTVSEDNLLAGATAHNSLGEQITGTVVVAPVDSEMSETSENPVQNKVISKAIKGAKTLSGSTGYTVTDSVEYPIIGLKVFGRSTQDGTPAPENPIQIVSVENPTITISNGTDSISLAITDTLNGVPVSSGGNVTIDGQEYIADYVDFERGVKVQRVGKTILTGVERWKPTGGRFGIDFPSSVPKIGICNYFVNVQHTADKDNSICIYTVWLDVRCTSCSSAEEFNSFLSRMNDNENPVTIYHVLATPIETPLSESEMQAYRQLQTYNGTTNISNDKGAGIEVSYCTNKALSACVAPITTGLQKQIDDLKSAVLSLGGNV